jgi:hypothetical protein
MHGMNIRMSTVYYVLKNTISAFYRSQRFNFVFAGARLSAYPTVTSLIRSRPLYITSTEGLTHFIERTSAIYSQACRFLFSNSQTGYLFSHFAMHSACLPDLNLSSEDYIL